MKRMIEVPLENGEVVLMEVDEPEASGRVVRGVGSSVAEKAEQTFEAGLERIKPAANALINKLRDLKESPEQVVVEFGIKLSAKAGAFIASADSEATFKISLTWKRQKPASGQ